MRIVGGRFSGRKLAALGKGAPEAQLRPTSDRVRESIFNILEHGDYPPLAGGRALDLFAGAGALGLEALSRGAERAVFVDDNPVARGLVRANLEALGLLGAAKVLRRDARRLGRNTWAPFTHVFLDPPYGRELAPAAIAAARDGGWLAEEATIVVEFGPDDAAPDGTPGVELSEVRRFGETQVAFARAAGAPR